jgi:HK97 family phage prohead protease
LGTTRGGTLKLSTDDVGLVFAVDLPDTADGHTVRELVERGDLGGASFGFIPGDVRPTVAPDGRQLRTHTSVRQLLDVSAVTYPAYPDTDVVLRAMAFDRPALDRRTQLILARHRARQTHREGY